MTHTLSCFTGVVLFAASAIAQSSPPGACVLGDASFGTLEGGCKDLVSNLVWSGPAGSMTWNNANAYAASLVEGGYTDWRLPTLAELQAAYANGGTSHLALDCQPCTSGVYVGWSSTLKGSSSSQSFKAWALDWISGTAQLILGRSRVYFNCVRQGTSSFTGGGNHSEPNRAVTHLLRDDRWSVVVDLPSHANAAFCMLVMNEPRAIAPRAPLVTGGPDPGLAGSDTAVMAGLGTFDATGRATLTVDAAAAGLAVAMLRDLTILLVVSDPKHAGPLLYRTRLPR